MKKIICPNCGAEYSIHEIFLPEAFMGSLKHVEKDSEGKITSYVGKDMDLTESYKCDYCNNPFKIKAKLDFDCKSKVESFSNKYTTKINKPHLIMKEV